MCEHVGRVTNTEVSFTPRSNKCIVHTVSYREVSLLQNVEVPRGGLTGLERISRDSYRNFDIFKQKNRQIRL